MNELQKLRRETEETLRRLRSQMDEYVIPDTLHNQLKSQLADVERLLAGAQSEAQAGMVREQVGKCERLWQAATSQVLLGGIGFVEAFSPDGTTLALFSGKKAVLWDVANGREQAVFQNDNDVYGVAFSPDGSTLACGLKKGMVQLWDLASRRSKKRLEGHEWSDVNALTFSPDGSILASASDDRTVRLWDLSSGRSKVLPHENQIHHIAFSPDSRLLASSSYSSRTVQLWDVESGREQAVLQGHTKGVWSLAFSPDGTTLASCSDDKTVRLWDVKSGRERVVLQHPGLVRAIATIPLNEMIK